MAVITISADNRLRVQLVSPIFKMTSPAGEDIQRGDYVRMNNNGYWVKGNATNAANLGYGGIALTTARNGLEVTVLIQGIIAFGTALSSLNYGDKVYVSNTNGALDTAPGTVERILGVVIPGWDKVAGTKLLYLQGW